MSYEWVRRITEGGYHYEKLTSSGYGVLYRPITKNEVAHLRTLPVRCPGHIGPQQRAPEWKAVIMGLTGRPVWGAEFYTEAEALSWCQETWEQDILPSSRRTSWAMLLDGLDAF